MNIRSFENLTPKIDHSAFIDISAIIIGDVTIGEDASIWPGCILRGDIQSISIGPRSNLQDGTVVHVTHDSRFCPGGLPTRIGANVNVGHRALLHACTVEDLCLIGMGAIIMDGAIVNSRVIVGAGSLVPPGVVLESGFLYVGSPARRTRPLTDQELEFLEYSAGNYVKLKNRYVGAD